LAKGLSIFPETKIFSETANMKHAALFLQPQNKPPMMQDTGVVVGFTCAHPITLGYWAMPCQLYEVATATRAAVFAIARHFSIPTGQCKITPQPSLMSYVLSSTGGEQLLFSGWLGTDSIRWRITVTQKLVFCGKSGIAVRLQV
jgi:hypothetical protein